MFESHNKESLVLSSLEFFNFRNYEYLSLPSLSTNCVFVGPNAVGKTNIVEAIQLLTALRSFRTIHYSQSIKKGCSSAKLKSTLNDGSRYLEYQLSLEEDVRNYSLNGKHKQIKELKGLLPSVLFYPDDLNLIKGPQSQRRDSLDCIGTQCSKNYYAVRSDYAKIHRQKTQALKEEAPRAMIESINDVLAKVGSQYIILRHTLLQQLLDPFKDAYKYISGEKEDSHISYCLSWQKEKEWTDWSKEGVSAAFSAALMDMADRERESQRCKIGPHADVISFILNDEDASFYASQGQQRSLVLAYKLAELEVIRNNLDKKPVLLLDDVMGELDEWRRQAFLKILSGAAQTFTTCTSLSYFDKAFIEDADIYHLPFYSVS